MATKATTKTPQRKPASPAKPAATAETTARKSISLPRIGRSKRQIQQEDAAPFIKLFQQVGMIMVCHAHYPALGDEKPTLRKDDVIIIPAGVKHRFINRGRKPAVTFNVYAPPAYPEGTKD